jgi:excisionase family DNA binding protein
MFITLTCDSYGKIAADGTPADPDAYDYQRAARDALHFAALFDRLIQNLRRFLGYDVQYFATVEPQRRLAPHLHVAIRGTLSRTELRQVLTATYHQVWWPPTGTVRFGEGDPPVWHEASGRYLDPATGEFLPTWDDALDAIGSDDEPLHVARFGAKFDAQGVLAGSRDSARCIGYLTKYLTKHVADCHQAQTDTQHAHAGRLADALRYEPCSPGCANWLRYGITPKNPREGPRPGRCTGKAHRREYLGYAGRRVLVSRKWSGKTLADHRADRKAWLMSTLGITEPDPSRYTWEPVTPGRRRPHATRTAALARRRRPRHLETSARRSQTPSRRGQTRGPFGKREGRVMPGLPRTADRLLTVEAAAERMSTSVRFIRRLIAERRIEFVKVGRHVRISETALAEFIEHLSIFVKDEPGALIFPGVQGGPLRRGNFNKMSAWPYAAKSIGAEGLHFHDLRHTGNTFAASSVAWR